MNPHGFSHLYELFATFTIAYIIIDELSENSFIRQISDKVLKKYNVIQDSIDKVKAKISGHETSIESIPKMNLKDPKVIPGIAESKSTLEAIAYRVKNFDEKINQRIKKNYKTKTFTFLNFYVLLYCLTMLYYGGLFEGLCHKEPTPSSARRSSTPSAWPSTRCRPATISAPPKSPCWSRTTAPTPRRLWRC